MSIAHYFDAPLHNRISQGFFFSCFVADLYGFGNSTGCKRINSPINARKYTKDNTKVKKRKEGDKDMV